MAVSLGVPGSPMLYGWVAVLACCTAPRSATRRRAPLAPAPCRYSACPTAASSSTTRHAHRVLTIAVGGTSCPGPPGRSRGDQARLATFLRETLGLELNASKTLITHARTSAARFLGYHITVQHGDTRCTEGQRSANGQIALRVPPDVITSQCARYRQHRKLWHRPGLQNLPDYDIVRIYGAEYRGVVNYYLLAQDVWWLHTLQFERPDVDAENLGRQGQVHRPQHPTKEDHAQAEARGQATMPALTWQTPRAQIRPANDLPQFLGGSRLSYGFGLRKRRRRKPGAGLGNKPAETTAGTHTARTRCRSGSADAPAARDRTGQHSATDPNLHGTPVPAVPPPRTISHR
jgi:hypothetical protein